MQGKLAQNVMHFARVLRAAGLPVGPDRVLDALRALEVAGIERRDDFYWTLAAVFLDRHEHFELFDQAFDIFWRDPRMLERDGAAELSEQLERLHKSCRKLIWLNPLLRYEGFEPRASGVRAMLPHVDAFLPVHNIDSLTALAAALPRAAHASRTKTRDTQWK